MKIRNILYADEGKILTDGETYGKIVYLAEGRTADEFHEISENEYDELTEKMQEDINV